jgi:hypothetical protein
VSEEEQIAELLEVLLKSRGVRIDVSAVAAFTLVGLLQLSLVTPNVPTLVRRVHVQAAVSALVPMQHNVDGAARLTKFRMFQHE